MLKQIFYIVAIFLIPIHACTPTEQKSIIMTSNKTGEMEIFVAGSDTMTIDWGDGTKKETHTLSIYDLGFSKPHRFIHTYSDTSYRMITMYGQNITHLHCQENQINILDVSKTATLEELWCDSNQLTSLDVSKNIMLTWLGCSYNQLTSLDVSKNTAIKII